jgi:hypothetical protein
MYVRVSVCFHIRCSGCLHIFLCLLVSVHVPVRACLCHMFLCIIVCLLHVCACCRVFLCLCICMFMYVLLCVSLFVCTHSCDCLHPSHWISRYLCVCVLSFCLMLFLCVFVFAYLCAWVCFFVCLCVCVCMSKRETVTLSWTNQIISQPKFNKNSTQKKVSENLLGSGPLAVQTSTRTSLHIVNCALGRPSLPFVVARFKLIVLTFELHTQWYIYIYYKLQLIIKCLNIVSVLNSGTGIA